MWMSIVPVGSSVVRDGKTRTAIRAYPSLPLNVTRSSARLESSSMFTVWLTNTLDLFAPIEVDTLAVLRRTATTLEPLSLTPIATWRPDLTSVSGIEMAPERK